MSDEQSMPAHYPLLIAHSSSKLQSRFSSRVGQGLHAPVIYVAAPIEYDFGHAFGLSALGDHFADGFRRRHITASSPVFLLAFGRAGGNQRLAVKVVNDLHVNVIKRAVHVKPRALRRSLHLLADAIVHVAALLVL